jgi:uncharacterized protein (DUF1697 family)
MSYVNTDRATSEYIAMLDAVLLGESNADPDDVKTLVTKAVGYVKTFFQAGDSLLPSDVKKLCRKIHAIVVMDYYENFTDRIIADVSMFLE